MEYLNTSMNTTKLRCDIDLNTLDTVLLVIFALASAASLVVNGLVVIVFFKYKKLRSTTFCFVLNMSISDIFLPVLRLFNLVLFLSPVYHIDVSKDVAMVLCSFITYFGNVSVAVSIQSLVLITVHRFLAVVFPLRQELESSKACFLVIFIIWIIAMATRFPDVIPAKLTPTGGCGSTMTRNQLIQYQFFKIATFRLLPLVIMIILYGIIIIKLRRQIVPGDVSFRQKERRRKRNKKLTRVSLAVIISFFLSWGVYDAIFVSLLFYVRCPLVLAYLAVEALPVVYTAVNPLIWFIFSKTYRKALTKMLWCFKTYKVQTTCDIELKDAENTHISS